MYASKTQKDGELDQETKSGKLDHGEKGLTTSMGNVKLEQVPSSFTYHGLYNNLSNSLNKVHVVFIKQFPTCFPLPWRPVAPGRTQQSPRGRRFPGRGGPRDHGR